MYIMRIYCKPLLFIKLEKKNDSDFRGRTIGGKKGLPGVPLKYYINNNIYNTFHDSITYEGDGMWPFYTV